MQKLQQSQSVKELSKHLFWDVDTSKLSFEESSEYIIERVCYIGTLDDWKLIRKIYGDEKIKNVLLNMRYLDEKSLNFYSLIYAIPKNNFRCYKLRQSGQIPTPF